MTQPTAEDIDAYLATCYEAYLTAMDAGDLDIADRMYTELDRLLDQRIHTTSAT